VAPQRLYIHSHNPLFRRVHSIVNFYIYFSFFKVDFNLLMFYNMKIGKAFSIHLVKLSSLTNKKHIPHSCYNTLFICFFILLVNVVVILHKQKWTTPLSSLTNKKHIPPSCYNTLFICFFILLVNVVVILTNKSGQHLQ